MKKDRENILKRLDKIIHDTAVHIHDFIPSKTAFTRKRKLDAAALLKTTITMQGNCLAKELFDAFDNHDLTNGRLMSVSAYVQQKSKLTPLCFAHILKIFNQHLFSLRLFKKQYRLFALDGSDFNQPFNPKSKNIVASNRSKVKPHCQVHVNALYDLLNNTYQDCLLQPRAQMDERGAAITMLARLTAGPYIVTMDRGYPSFNLLENCNRLPNCFYVIRARIGQGASKEIRNLPRHECDQDIVCQVTTSSQFYESHRATFHHVQHHYHQYKEKRSKNTKDERWDFGRFCQVKFRACKIRINNPRSDQDEWEVLLTNLDRKKFPLSSLKTIYHLRWGIESSFRHLKYDLGSIQFHSKQDRFIDMEILAHMIMFNTVSQINAQVFVPQRHGQYHYRVNFKMSCIIVREKYRLSSSNMVFASILVILSRYTVPVRPGRQDKRKIRPQSARSFIYRVV